ncbi:P-loop containing nucleoside triphosphate hydrolase protein [Aspergillus niger]|uniref:ATP-binding protein n=1 Tax=Aspergillus lacticoffeatus (strain CBS 101883) TaxID=1450533 RepID=UPI000D7F641D|nr:P-loop containing nucleoside triphosphate hydrolase protein [Aspergillus niger CBS 101883]PYH52062.1 P-loop containing nucleoside triphosphate hydrolase protein [Aspergillus niger CBS 101883]GJP95237.1 P-loop containing nucleoside triphosphate hydrolase protein [Aspergillus niger]
MDNEGRALHRQHPYALPAWFVAENVKTKSEHRTGIRLLRNSNLSAQGDEEASPCTDTDGVGRSKNEDNKDQMKTVDEYMFQEKRYAELYDLATAALLSKTSFPKLKRCGIWPCMAVEVGSSACATAIIDHLAGDMGASCISAGPEDLYKLAREFHQQDQSAQHRDDRSICADSICRDENKQSIFPDEMVEHAGSDIGLSDDNNDTDYAIMDDRDRMIKYQFGDRQSLRSQCSLKSMLNAPLAKIEQKPSPSDSHSMAPKQSAPVILHIRNSYEIDCISYAILGNFLNAVMERWRNNELVLLIVSDMNHDSRRQLNIVPSFIVWFDNPKSPNHRIASETEKKQREIASRFRKLKGSIRERLPKGFGSELLSDAVHLDIPDTLLINFHDDMDYTLIACQILGRVCIKGALELSDILEVLRRLNSEEPPPPGPPKNGLMEVEEPSFTGKVDAMRKNCNKFELGLLKCIADSETQKVTYDDIILEQNVKDHLRHLVRLLRTQIDGFSKTLLEEPRATGVLLHGPPGTGKTHLARAIANEFKATMLWVKPADIVSDIAGDAEKAIHAAFTLAKKLSPCILFIDEVDALFHRRSADDQSWRRTALAQFLQEVDALSRSQDTTFILCATSRLTDLDEAFLQRFPYKVMTKLPGEKERLTILQTFLKRPDTDPEVSLKALARQTAGLSGSDLRSLCRQAALHFAMDEASSHSPGSAIKTPTKLHLKAQHFIEALRNIKPSVSRGSQTDIEAPSRLGTRGSIKAGQNGGSAGKATTEPSIPESPVSDNETAFL